MRSPGSSQNDMRAQLSHPNYSSWQLDLVVSWLLRGDHLIRKICCLAKRLMFHFTLEFRWVLSRDAHRGSAFEACPAGRTKMVMDKLRLWKIFWRNESVLFLKDKCHENRQLVCSRGLRVVGSETPPLWPGFLRLFERMAASISIEMADLKASRWW